MPSKNPVDEKAAAVAEPRTSRRATVPHNVSDSSFAENQTAEHGVFIVGQASTATTDDKSIKIISGSNSGRHSRKTSLNGHQLGGKQCQNSSKPSSSAALLGSRHADMIQRSLALAIKLPFQLLHTILVALYVVAFVLLAPVANLIQVIVLYAPRRINEATNNAMAAISCFFLQVLFEHQMGRNLTMSGLDDYIRSGHSALLIGNHVSLYDFLLLNALSSRSGMLHACKTFMYYKIKYMPFLGWGAWLAGLPVMRQDWTKDEITIKNYVLDVKERKLPIWMLIYVEGGRITKPLLEECQRFSVKRGLPVLKNVLIPRVKGLAAVLEGLRGSHVEHVYDMTYIYYNGKQGGLGVPPSWTALLTGQVQGCHCHVDVRRYAISEIPSRLEDTTQWLMDVFARKDALLESFKLACEAGQDPSLALKQIFPPALSE